MLKPSDMVAIPFGDAFALAKTIYISERVKDVFGFTVFARIFSKPDCADLEGLPYLTFSLGAGDVKVLYADKKTVTKKKLWTVVGTCPVTDDDRALLLHGVGGTLYDGNARLREFTSPEDRKAWPQVLTFGNDAVNKALEIGFRESGLLD